MIESLNKIIFHFDILSLKVKIVADTYSYEVDITVVRYIELKYLDIELIT